MNLLGASHLASIGDWDNAYTQYLPLAQNHPQDLDVQLRFAEICINTHRLREAFQTMSRLEGRRVAKAELEQVKRVERQLEHAVIREQKLRAALESPRPLNQFDVGSLPSSSLPIK